LLFDKTINKAELIDTAHSGIIGVKEKKLQCCSIMKDIKLKMENT
jgi:hypothetical protein